MVINCKFALPHIIKIAGLSPCYFYYALNFHNTHINVTINTIYSFLEKRLLWNGFKILCTRMCRVASLDGLLSAH